ncbi:radical SAM family heme chaperone HemW [Flavitalea sp. BT771]|uniref:radical SAM family heme chaperone HemW n=1 Tax=Flavitalea sp. BT771 TaxID=3063329 RepID=UPI0026E1A243|nr:radical SAM family heme chaperone HemW [Flavitalea sp. BT771]MDO6431639.1 radical SAM family heme chaperone HemW [Flavitalea sp. BT771]MDV6220547.1 radical SAM family heme chaperone HemW [Flavitalea sp. BT771]
MGKFEYKYDNPEGPVDPATISLHIDGRQEPATREEFYTNYPFYKYWTSDSNARLLSPEGINIYIHIPFCIQICDYCFYMKELIKSKDQVEDYVESLCMEIKMISERYSLAGKKVNSIYVGGGTPSVLTEPQFRKVVETLHKYHRIEDPEFAFEAEPGTFSRNKLEWLRACGVNRISMGVQSFDDEVIRLSSRKHTAAQAINSIRTVQDTGGFEVNIDLLSGLAGESMSSWEASIATAVQQQTDMLTIYKMKTYANTVFFKKGVHSKEIDLPGETQEIAYMQRAMEICFSEGLDLWSTFAFNRKGAQSVYIENTWRGEDMIAYGASSFGKIGSINYQNLNNIPAWSEKVRNNTMPVYRTFSMTYKDMIVKELLLCAARLFSYSKKEFVDKFGFDYFCLIPDVIDQLTDKGYITNDKEELVLTRQGILFGDFVSKTIASSVKNAFARDSIGFAY